MSSSDSNGAASQTPHDDIKLQPKKHNTRWLESARLWGLLVGDVSAMKSPALKETVGPLSRISSEMARENAEAMGRWYSLPPPVKKVTPPPRQPQVMTMNATPEAVQQIADSPWRHTSGGNRYCR